MSSSVRPGTRAGKSGEKHVIKFRTFLHNTVFDVMKHRGWKETDNENDWDVTWADVHWIREVFDHVHLDEHQRVNHFRNHYEMTRKDLLIKNLKRMRKSLEREDRQSEALKYELSPPTYVVPAEYSLFVEEFKKYPGALWIMKPIGKAQGKGIFLFNKLSQISDWKKDPRWKAPDAPQAETYIVQRYVENPYLIGGKKFDLRIYCLVTAYNPLTAWLYRGGFGRFANHRFTLNTKDIQNTYIHLTNVAVQKTAENYNAEAGCKWDINALKMAMIAKHGLNAVNLCFAAIQDVVIRSLLAVQKIMINDKHCFELYGFDILIDDTLRPWLLEVNASPSLTAETPYDYNLKFGMLDDMFTIIDPEKRLRGDEQSVGGFDLIYRDGFVKHDGMPFMPGLVHPTFPSPILGPTFLGCFNDRVRQLKKMQKAQNRAKAIASAGPSLSSASSSASASASASAAASAASGGLLQNSSSGGGTN